MNTVITSYTPQQQQREEKVKVYSALAHDAVAMGQMRVAVGVVLESVGFTHCMRLPLDILTDVGARFITNLSEKVKNHSNHGLRNGACMRDCEVTFHALGLNVDEMNEYMKQVRPPYRPPTVPNFPVRTERKVRYEEVPPLFRMEVPEFFHEGLPPVSTVSLYGDQSKASCSEENEEEEQQPSTSKHSQLRIPLLNGLPGVEALPKFASMTSHALRMKKEKRKSIPTVSSARRKEERRKSNIEEMKYLPSRSLPYPPSTSYDENELEEMHVDIPVNDIPSSYTTALQHPQSSASSSLSSALHRSSFPFPSTYDVPKAASIPPSEYMHTHTDPLFACHLLSASSHATPLHSPPLSLPNTLLPQQIQQEQHDTSSGGVGGVTCGEELFDQSLDAELPPDRLVQLVILRSIFSSSREYPLSSTLDEALATIQCGSSSVSGGGAIGVPLAASTPLPPPLAPTPTPTEGVKFPRLKIYLKPPTEEELATSEKLRESELSPIEEDEERGEGGREKSKKKHKKSKKKKDKRDERDRDKSASSTAPLLSPSSAPSPLTGPIIPKLKIKLGPKPSLQ